MENGNKYQCIMSAPLAKILINKGYIVRNIAPDHSNKERVVFFFDKTAEIFKEIEVYKNNKKT